MRFTALFLVFYISIILYAHAGGPSAEFLAKKDEFISSALKYHKSHGVKFINKKENHEEAGYSYIPDAQGNPYAVIKPGLKRESESFIYEYAEGLGLHNLIAPSYTIDDFPDEQGSTRVTLEAFIPLIPHGTKVADIPKDIYSFVDKYKDERGATTLAYLNRRMSPKDRSFFLHHVNTENLHHLFILYALTHLGDMMSRNALVTLNATNQFELRIIDTEDCFNFCPSWGTFVLGFPQASETLCQTANKLVPAILSHMEDFKDRITALFQTRGFNEDEGGFDQQLARMSALNDFITEYPKASPRALVLFSYWNTSFAQYGVQINLAVKAIRGTDSGGFGYYNFQNDSEFEERIWILRYGFNDLATALTQFHKTHKESPESLTFRDLLTFLKETAFAKQKKSDEDWARFLEILGPIQEKY